MAEEKTYVFGEGAGNGILGLLGPMLSQRGVDPNVLLVMQGRDREMDYRMGMRDRSEKIEKIEKEAYECGYEDGYDKAMEEMMGGRSGYRSSYRSSYRGGR